MEFAPCETAEAVLESDFVTCPSVFDETAAPIPAPAPDAADYLV